MHSNKIVLFSTLACAAACACAASPTIPVEAFAQEPEYTTPRLSPDGKHIALNVRIKRNGRMIPTMSVYSLPELKLESMMAMKGFEIPVNFQWITNTRLVVSKGLMLGLRE